MSIRPEQRGDEAAIDSVLRAAFPTHLEAELVRALRAADRLTVSLVAEDAGQIVGHVAFSPVTAGAAVGGVGLAPLSVLPACQRQGIGGQLVQAGLAACRDAGCQFVVVLGDPAYYSRFGFSPAARWQLSDEYHGGDAFQALELQAGAIPQGPMLVRYTEEFGMFSEG